MPATRSRTQHWRQSLQQLHERGGGLEISVARPGQTVPGPDADGSDIIFRCKILGLSDDEILLQRPVTLGQPVPIAAGVNLIGVIAIGQNRWMFQTQSLGPAQIDVGGRRMDAIRIAAPERVERCQRRSFYRVSTTGLVLPTIKARTLLDPSSAVASEIAIRTRYEMLESGQLAGTIGTGDQSLATPVCGPAFEARLMNLGGGGAGLLIEADEAERLERSRPLWLMIDLAPHVPVPVGVVARAAHTHIDSQRRLYAGVAFDFSHHAEYKPFVTDLFCAYVQAVQREQLRAQDEQSSTA